MFPGGPGSTSPTAGAESKFAFIGVAVLDRDLRFLQATDVFARLGGRHAGNALSGRRFDEVFPDAGANVLRALRHLVEGRKRLAVMRLSLTPSQPQGDVGRRHWRIAFRPERDGDGRLKTVNAVAEDTTTLHRARARARLQFAFQEVLIRISSAFINLPADRVDAQVRDGLRQLVDFFQCDRAILSQTNAAGQLEMTHLHSVAAFPQLPRVVVDDAFPWLTKLIRQGNVVRIRDGHAEIPAEATHERAWMHQTGARSHLTIPFAIGGMPLCALSLTSKRPQTWPPEFIPRLRLAGTIFVNAVLRKRADEDLQRTRSNLAHMSRVQTMGELATSIAHEVNQPLCAMVNNAQAAQRLLAAKEPDVLEVNAALGDIIADGRRASDVIGRTREMLKRHDVRFDVQDVNDLIRRVQPDLANFAMLRHVTLVADLSPDVPPVLGHGVQIQQVVTNLLVNAIESIPPERGRAGRVVISTSVDAGKAEVLMRVDDNGIGLHANDADRIFQPFFTSKASGMGMGLAISRSIAESHSGRLWAQPNPAGGATFCLALPARPGWKPRASPAKQRPGG